MRRCAIDRRGGSTGARDGFALVEVMVAFVVLALGIGAISIGVAIAMRSDRKASQTRDMARIAQSRLEAAGVLGPLATGRREGRTGRFRWQEIVTPVRIKGVNPRDEPQPQPESLVAVWVEIAISAADGTEEKIGALKLVPEPVQR